jgi:preprotein translocase subunit SecA
MIAEMKTGEGKTLVSTLPSYLNALTGKGDHVVTVNDYLAERDSEWMGRVYTFLGMTVGCITNQLEDEERRRAYACDITYGTNNEFGFDYLRDNMKFELEEMVQREFQFAIVDEVDSILIDEARTPLIISGPAEDSSDLYTQIDKLMPKLIEGDYEKDEKQKTVALTDQGMEHIEQILKDAGLIKEGNLYDLHHVSHVHHVNQALRAHTLFHKDTDYIVKDGQVILIDEFTGRMMEGRRYSEGLHQALEAKEGVTIEQENQTLASITFQNYFRMYPKLAGMTGTAMTEAAEFHDIYMIEESQKKGQPVLVGTVSIEKSEELADKLKKRKITHKVLNARHHEQEAHIIAQGGAPGAVTIATNMAGRGTDIKLGGNAIMLLEEEAQKFATDEERDKRLKELDAKVEAQRQEVLKSGGLLVIGTERHESRRVDNQLRGRSGRQGDPGASRFFISLEDDLMRIFGSQRLDVWLTRLGLKDGEAIIHPWINKALEKAQRKVEERNFEIRKNLLKYDDVMNDQRKVIYKQRVDLMRTDDCSENVQEMREQVIEDLVEKHIPESAYQEQWDLEGLLTESLATFGLELPIREWADEEGVADQEIFDRMLEAVNQHMAKKTAEVSAEIMRMAEKSLLLQILDHQWKEHLLQLDHLRQAVNLRAYGQRDPLIEYKKEAFDMFNKMNAEMQQMVVSALAHLEIDLEDENALEMPSREQAMYESRIDPALMGAGSEGMPFGMADYGELPPPEGWPEDGLPPPGYGEGNGEYHDAPTITPVRSRQASDMVDPNNAATWGKVARNAPCPCDSGKKYKHCHGKVS